MGWILEIVKNLPYQVQFLCQAVVLLPILNVFLKLMTIFKSKANLLRE